MTMQVAPNDRIGYVITGATGWLGRVVLERLDMAPGKDVPIYAFARTATTVVLRTGRAVVMRPLNEMRNLPEGSYRFLHLAYLTRDRTAEMTTEAFVARCEEITDCVLDAARRVQLRGFFYPSSGAVYSKDGTLEQDLDRNPYGALKVRDERSFTALAASMGCPMVVARVFNLAGPYINKVNNYALPSILNDILNDRPVRLKAAHRVIRSYVHVADVVELALACLAADETVLFDTAGEGEIEVGELARMAAEELGKSNWPVERPVLGDRIDRYVGDGTRQRALAAKYGISFVSLRSQIRDTAQYMRQVC